jgi:predicted ATPase
MDSENSITRQEFLEAIERLSENIKSVREDLKTDYGTIENRLTQMETTMARKFSDMDEDLSQKIQDGLDKYATSVKFIKNYISEPSNGFRPARPFSQQMVIPRSISTYAVQKVPSEPWDPPKWPES